MNKKYKLTMLGYIFIVVCYLIPLTPMLIASLYIDLPKDAWLGGYFFAPLWLLPFGIIVGLYDLLSPSRYNKPNRGRELISIACTFLFPSMLIMPAMIGSFAWSWITHTFFKEDIDFF